MTSSQDYANAIEAVNMFHFSIMKEVSNGVADANVLGSPVVNGAFDQIWLLLGRSDLSIGPKQ
ncbi:hypothetical protein H4R20_006877, partial [Coemansia guatemalensis]